MQQQEASDGRLLFTLEELLSHTLRNRFSFFSGTVTGLEPKSVGSDDTL